MSQADKERWDQRYLGGAYSTRLSPSVLVEKWAPLVLADSAGSLRAFDVACGAGRNTLYLSKLGFEVVGADISTAALERAAAQAQSQSLSAEWCQLDLDETLPIAPPLQGEFDFIVLVRYADLELVESLIKRLAPGGVLLVEAHLGGPLFTESTDGEHSVGGPGSERFRLPPGALAAACAGLVGVFENESLVTDPDGTVMALAQFVGRRPG